MKYSKSALALVIVSAFLAGCANTADDPKPAAATAAPAASPADAALDKKVEAAIAGESQLSAEKVSASVKDGAVTLTGTTKNDWLKYVAETTAKKVDGVKSVKNDIKVPD
jgi:hyperosmotically inducible protein